MQILVSGNRVVAIAPQITFGEYDESFKKWRMADEEGNLLYYAIDHDYTLVNDVILPDDYEEGKYFFENGEFVLDKEWRPYVSDAERIATLEAQNADSIEIEAELLYEISLMQLGMI